MTIGTLVAAVSVILVGLVGVVGTALMARHAEQPTASPGPTKATGSPTQDGTVAIYYVGDTPSGPRLFREFHAMPPTSLDGILNEVAEPAADPDYRTIWSPGQLDSVSVTSEAIVVDLADPGPAERPATLDATDAELAIQQVVLTLQAAVGDRRPVRFTQRDSTRPLPRLLGVDTSGPIAAAPADTVLAPVSISNPVEGRVASGEFSADGRAASFEGTVPWTLTDPAGQVVRSGTAQAAGEDPGRLTAWSTGPIDVGGLEPGRYVFAASTVDPSGGAEGVGVTTDTREVFVQ